MNTTTLIYIALGILILGIAFFLLKSLVKAAIITVLILVIFRVGWIYSSDQVISLFRLDKIMSPDKVAEFRIRYEDYKERREDDPVIIPEAVDDTIQSELREKLDDYLDKMKNQPEE